MSNETTGEQMDEVEITALWCGLEIIAAELANTAGPIDTCNAAVISKAARFIKTSAAELTALRNEKAKLVEACEATIEAHEQTVETLTEKFGQAVRFLRTDYVDKCRAALAAAKPGEGTNPCHEI